MKAILWKEFRENLKWGVLLLLASAFGIIKHQFVEPNQIVLFNAEYAILSTLGFAAGALALGLLQTVFEGSRDRWAFLIHRGISPERILLAKALVGLSYFLAATVIPLLGMAWWCSQPGNVPAPWHPIAPLAGVVGIFASIPAWFAGVLIGWRDVRWYGVRLLPAGLALFAVVFALTSTLYWDGPRMLLTIPASLVITAVYAAAATGVVRHRAGYVGQPGATRWCLALTTVCGSLMLLLALSMMTVEGLREFRSELFQPVLLAEYHVTEDGRFVRLDRIRSTANLRVEVVDPATGERTPHHEIDLYQPNGFRVSTDGPYPRGNQSGQYKEVSVRMGGLGAGRWYYLPQQGILAGYSQQSYDLVWRFGPDGPVSDGQAPTRRFSGMVTEASVGNTCYIGRLMPTALPQLEPDGPRPSEVVWFNTFAFEEGLYRFSRSGNRVTRIYEASPDKPLVAIIPAKSHGESAVWFVSRRSARKIILPMVASGSDESVIVPDEDTFSSPGLPGYEIHFPDGLPTSGFQVYDLPAIDQVAYRWMILPGSPGVQIRSCLVLATRDGEILRQIEHDAPIHSHNAMDYMAPVLPPVITEALGLADLYSSSSPLPGVDTERYVAAPRQTVRLVFWLSSLLVAGITALLARRWNQPKQSLIRWLVGIAVFGPAALVTLLALRERPRCQACADCGRRRPLSETECPHCSQPFPKPESDGTEILMPMTGAADPASADIVPAAGV